jgi:hypothetical protein
LSASLRFGLCASLLSSLLSRSLLLGRLLSACLGHLLRTGLRLGLCALLRLGLSASLRLGLSASLRFGLCASLRFGLSACLRGHLLLHSACLQFGLSASLQFGLSASLQFGLCASLQFGLCASLSFGLGDACLEIVYRRQGHIRDLRSRFGQHVNVSRAAGKLWLENQIRVVHEPSGLGLGEAAQSATTRHIPRKHVRETGNVCFKHQLTSSSIGYARIAQSRQSENW